MDDIFDRLRILDRLDRISEKIDSFSNISEQKVNALKEAGLADEVVLLGLDAMIKNRLAQTHVHAGNIKLANVVLDEQEVVLDRIEELVNNV